ncbi:MAG: hypothetical protein ACOX16_03170 [Candidatus Izemoplasmatales bacterium]|jgi:hypothetical protein|nr:hypothetical protein [Acholeplasmataceae bacterium]
MKKIFKVAVIALFGLALLSFSFKSMMDKGVVGNDNHRVVMVDFDNSGDPEYVAR